MHISTPLRKNTIIIQAVFYQTDKLAGGVRGSETTWNHIAMQDPEGRSCELRYQEMLPVRYFF